MANFGRAEETLSKRLEDGKPTSLIRLSILEMLIAPSGFLCSFLSLSRSWMAQTMIMDFDRKQGSSRQG